MLKVPLSHKVPLSPTWRRALELLAERRGTAGAVLLAHGFTPETLESLVLSGLASTNAEVLPADATIAAPSAGRSRKAASTQTVSAARHKSKWPKGQP
jgi:hypothetical protein